MLLAYEVLNGRNGHDVGRALLAKLYRQATDTDLPEILCTATGKPYFPDSGWHFSISHTKNHAFCVLAEHPVGIDAEETDRKIDPRLAHRYFSEIEQTRLRSDDDLLRLWVLKEATAKRSGRGIGNWLKTTAFHPDDNRITIIDGCYVAVVEEYDAI